MPIKDYRPRMGVATRRGRRRGGLSTLEMVLCLPILLLMMALMINYGTRWCWKARAESVARQAVWSSRYPRRAASNPWPDYWPADADVGAGGEADAPSLDDPRVDQPVARGPLPYGTEVDGRLLDPTRGFRQGSASLERYYPMLRKLGPYHLRAGTDLLDDKWQYQQMGLWRNRQRRIPVLYALAKAPSGLVAAYSQAASELMSVASRAELRPLDNDEEFIYYRGHAPDFHPRLRMFDTLDLELAAERVEDLIARIQGKVERDDNGNVTRRIPGVPERMTRAFIGLYESVIRQLEEQYSPDPPPPAVQAEIRELEAKITILRQFLETLQSDHGN